MHLHLPPIADVLGGSLGLAVIVFVLGWLLLTWHRDRNHFLLMRTALEKGITRFPDAPPYWLVSMRQGLTMLALGLALLVVGGGTFYLGHHTAGSLQLTSEQLSQAAPEPPPPPAEERGAGHRPPPPPRPSPVLEQWHQAQNEQVVGLSSMAIGIILGLVGLVRVLFAQAERHVALESTGRDIGI